MQLLDQINYFLECSTNLVFFGKFKPTSPWQFQEMEDKTELQPEDDDIDSLFDWAVSTFNSGGIDLTDYTATLKGKKITTVSDGNTTINLEVNND